MPPRLRLFNTMTRQKQDFLPIREGHATIYTCGPTVYRYVHVGNLRTFMFADLLCRVLEFNGLAVTQVKNITDVGHLTDDTFDRGEDKMLVAARLENRTSEEIAAHYTAAFMEDERRLNIRPAAAYPRASDHIPHMIELIQRLLDLGHAYVADGTVYYDIASFPSYGRLSGNSPGQLLAGTRGEVDPNKRNPGDFTLWKSAGPRRQASWESPWGAGFPGWHIECSAMSMAHLGDRFDLHTGGADNIFPHHEAEIAQSEGSVGHQVVGCWMHGQLLMLAGTRMAKSAGNFVRVTDLEEAGFDPLAFRYLALQARYRAPLNFGIGQVEGADRALRSLREKVAEWSGGPSAPAGDSVEWRRRFISLVNDDLDLPGVMALVSELTRSQVAPGSKSELMLEFDRVLGLDLGRVIRPEPLPAEAGELLDARQKARSAGDWAASDRLREELAKRGVRVTDTPAGQRWTLTSKA